MNRESWYEDDCVVYTSTGRPMIPNYLFGVCYKYRGTSYPEPFKRFKSMALAKGAMKYILMRQHTDLDKFSEPVKCPYCGYYHIINKQKNEH